MLKTCRKINFQTPFGMSFTHYRLIFLLIVNIVKYLLTLCMLYGLTSDDFFFKNKLEK